MLEEKSVAELREAVHALAQAIALIPEIYVRHGGKIEGIEAKIFSDLLEEVLAKTSHHKDGSPNRR